MYEEQKHFIFFFSLVGAKRGELVFSLFPSVGTRYKIVQGWWFCVAIMVYHDFAFRVSVVHMKLW